MNRIMFEAVAETRRRFTVENLRGRGPRWRCKACLWTSAANAELLPEAHQCTSASRDFALAPPPPTGTDRSNGLAHGYDPRVPVASPPNESGEQLVDVLEGAVEKATDLVQKTWPELRGDRSSDVFAKVRRVVRALIAGDPSPDVALAKKVAGLLKLNGFLVTFSALHGPSEGPGRGLTGTGQTRSVHDPALNDGSEHVAIDFEDAPGRGGREHPSPVVAYDADDAGAPDMAGFMKNMAARMKRMEAALFGTDTTDADYDAEPDVSSD